MDCRPLLFEPTLFSADIIDYSRIPHVPTRLPTSYVALCSLKSSLTKKLIPKDKATLNATRERAYLLFSEMNARCESFRSYDSDLIRQMRFIAESDFCHVPDWHELLCQSGLIAGPGASVSSNGRNSSFEKFFVNDITTTNPFLYGEYFRYIREDASFLYAERMRRHIRGRAFELVDGSQLSSVPKNDRIDRMICTEPSLNMLFQRSLGEHINYVLKRNYGYDPALQPDLNRELARLGSLHATCGTIDLSSASDTISFDLCQRILPSWLCAAIDDCRCKSTTWDREVIPLHMMSTMGNGFTFPLQTYIFTILVRAVALRESVKFSRFGDGLYGVFGDDIVVPSRLFDSTLEALSSLGFIPNSEKSFNHGYFRESCGTDWYDGVDVRGVYCKSIDTVQERYSLINRLVRFSARHAVDLRPLCQALLPLGWKHSQVPSDVPDDAGLKTPAYYGNECLNRFGVYSYWEYSPVRKRFKIWMEDQLIPSHYNPYGIVKAACVSSVASGLDRRSSPVRYRRTRAVAPFWVRQRDMSRYHLSVKDWEMAFATNIDIL